MKHKIKVITNGTVTKVYCPKSKEDTKKLYYQLSENLHSYTLLIVDGMALTTGGAERYLGKRARDKNTLLLAEHRGAR